MALVKVSNKPEMPSAILSPAPATPSKASVKPFPINLTNGVIVSSKSVARILILVIMGSAMAPKSAKACVRPA